MSDDKTEYTFWWFIENYSYCWHKVGEKLTSPEFTADGLKGTVWHVSLFPRGEKEEGIMSLFLNRNSVDDGTEDFQIQYELAILAANGPAVCSSKYDVSFKRGIGYGCTLVLPMNDVLRRKEAYLPQDALTVRCKIWIGDKRIQHATVTVARTRIGIEHISFVLLRFNGDFSALKQKGNIIVPIKTASLDLLCSLYFSDELFGDEKVIVEIKSSDDDDILSRCKLSLLDGSGKEVACGEFDNRFDATRKDIMQVPHSITSHKIPKSDGDEFSLLCECTFSTGTEYEKIERTLYEMPLLVFNRIISDEKTKKISDCSSLPDDLKGIYDDKCLTDVKLKTKTKSFPAHKAVLCARSPVFKATLTNDMKEKINNVIHVDDLDDETVQQLLLFLYSDKVENQQWESAIKLYYASDKYAVEKLKLMCSSFLLASLSASTASEVLLLADRHSDTDFKKSVEDFILNHEEQVFGSDEWEKLTETNPLLVSKTMLLKYKRNI